MDMGMGDEAFHGDTLLPSLHGDAGGGFSAVVVGAGGGIGGAIHRQLSENPHCRRLHACARDPSVAGAAGSPPGGLAVDLDDEASIAAAAAAIGGEGTPALVIGATGMLHDPGAGLAPEKSWRQMTHGGLAEYYRANCVGPAMLAKHFLPLMPRKGKAVFALLSGRVGSIGDNRTGGWHGYRAAKAGLNMLIRNFAVEMRARNPDAVVLGLHPGTVATGLSAPFRGNVRHGVLAPDESAGHLLAVVDAAGPEQSGCQIDWRGAIIPN